MQARNQRSSGTSIDRAQMDALFAFALAIHDECEGNLPRFVLQYKGNTYLLYIKREYEPDENWALRIANLGCLLRKVPPPASIYDALLMLSYRNIVGIPVKKMAGRPIDWERDAQILVRIDWYRKQRREPMPGCVQGAKPSRYSITEASEKVEEEFAAERQFLTTKGKPLTASAIESAYYAAKKRFFVKCVPANEMSSTWAFPPKLRT